MRRAQILKADHIFKMTTQIGFYQFAHGTAPNKKFGYSIDDQTRALILTLSLYQQKSARGGSAFGRKEKKKLKLARIYFKYIE